MLDISDLTNYETRFCPCKSYTDISFELSICIPWQVRCIKIICNYIKIWETCKSICDVLKFGCTFNYTLNSNDQTI